MCIRDRGEGVKTQLLLILCAIWILFGLIGHAPWKPIESTSISIVKNILDTGSLVAPLAVDAANLESPPLYYLSAAVSAKLFSPWLDVYKRQPPAQLGMSCADHPQNSSPTPRFHNQTPRRTPSRLSFADGRGSPNQALLPNMAGTMWPNNSPAPIFPDSQRVCAACLRGLS